MRTFLTCMGIGILSSGFSQSVLSEGNWYKVGTTESGIYKIDRAFITGTLGISASSIDPSTLKVYGNGVRGMLPQPNSTYRPNDPQELAIFASGDQDKKLDEPDYFLFYSQGPDRFLLDSSGAPVYEKNLYCDTVYHFITYGGAKGKRITTREPSESLAPKQTTFFEYFVHEKDLDNQLGSGRNWLGEGFIKGTGNLKLRYDPLNFLGNLKLWTAFGADSEGACSFDISINGTQIGNVPIDPIPDLTYGDKQKFAEASYVTTVSGNDVNLEFHYNHSAGNSKGFLDYFILGTERSLVYSDQPIVLNIPKGDEASFEITSNQDLNAWGVTDLLNVSAIPTSKSGNKVSLNSTSADQLIIISSGSSFSSPVFFKKIAPQNIKSFSSSDGLIVTHPRFSSEAKRLAQFHQSEGLRVEVATTDQVYNEFGSGSPDLTAIRDFLRFHYLKDSTLRYALLFGDGSYDYKLRAIKNTNLVPIYESRESSHNIYSHSSDDYFSFFEENEGEWYEGKRKTNSSTYEIPYVDHTCDIGIGRIPVNTLEEATNVVDKIIRYKTATQTLGKWKHQIAYLADDGDLNEHMEQAEEFYQIIDQNHFEYNAKKLYLDLYDQSVSAQEQEISPIGQAVKNALKEGVFILDYMGHGNEEQLTSIYELALDRKIIRSLTNRHKLPLFVTATCEFGKYDDPSEYSGAEELLLNKDGGAIALITTTRPVYAHTNFGVNAAFHRNVFKKIDSVEFPRLGDVIRLTKNESLGGPINRNFALLGDPMLQLNYPQYDITFDQLKEPDTLINQDTLSALEVYTLSGEIRSGGSLVDYFNGTATVTLWDIPQTKITKGDESDPFSFTEQSNALYRGEFSVVDGKYSAEFIIPKNSSYKFQPGKMTVYAADYDNFIDASASSRNFVLGGSAQMEEDNQSPEVTIYLNESGFRSGGTVGPSSLFIAKLTDEHGINISNNGFGRGITLQLNDDEPMEVNEFYTADKDTYKAGTLMFPLQNLTPGHYTAKLKVSDTYNNFTEKTVEFKVSESPILKLFNVMNYPNPVRQDATTTFTFEHDREDEELQVSLILYNMQGRQVNQWKYNIDSSPRVIDDLSLRMSSYQGVPLENGIYLYRLNVSSTLDGASNEVTRRLIIIN
ncbi:MAG: type IX secretion system sortase PorU [Marinoscillum sp.]